jgi:hypothetical protein
VYGAAYFRRVLAGVVDILWPVVARTAALAFALIGLSVIAFAPGAGGEVALTLLQGVLAVTLMSPWIVVMLGASWSSTSSAGIRARAQVIAIHRHGMDLATPVLSVVLALPILTTASLYFPDGSLEGGLLEGLSLVAFGTFLTLIMLAALQFELTALRHDSQLLREEIADLAPAYRRHVLDVLVERGLDVRMPHVWVAMIPFATGLVTAGVGWTWA